MQNNDEESENFKNNIKKKQEKIFQDVAKNYDETIEHGKNIGKKSIEKITESTTTSATFIKNQPYWKSLKNNSLKIKEKTLDSGILLKKKGPRFYKKISNGFFYFFESVVGRIKIGTQYGASSVETLEKLSKLKELGIITDEEFAKKKKKILDRI
ncbi:MAG: SHOCT domain-containing protein [Nitrosarchaeum sp.]